MLKKMILIGLLLSGSLYSQIQWEKYENVLWGITPDLAIDPRNGELHVLGLYQGIAYRKLDVDENWTRPEMIPNSGGEIGLLSASYFGPAIAVDQNGKPHICYRTNAIPNTAYKDHHRTHIYYRYRTESGWSDPLLVAEDIRRGYVVRMAIDQNNVVHVVHSEVDDPTAGVIGTFSYYQIWNNNVRKRQIRLGRHRADNRLEIDVDPDGGVHVIVGNPDPQHGPIDYYTSPGGMNDLAFKEDIHHPSAWSRNGAPDIFVDKNSTVHFVYGTRYDSDLGNKGSIRYAQYQDDRKRTDRAITPQTGTGALEPWKDAPYYNGWGLGSIAATSEGELIVAGYLTKNAGPLYTVYSTDEGQSWSAPEYRAPAWGSENPAHRLYSDGRSVPVLRGFRNNIYLIYQNPNDIIEIQYLRNIGDELPFADAGGPYEGFAGQPVLFDATASADSGFNAGIARYEWDWEDNGVYDVFTGLPTITHTYPDSFVGQVRLRVTDKSGNPAEATAPVVIRNNPPTVTARPDTAIDEGQSVTFSADFSPDTQTLTWEFSEGETAAGETVTRLYPDDGHFTVIVTAADKYGAVGRDTLHVTVRNLPPIADAGGPYFGSRNFPVELRGTATDPGVNDILTYSWDLTNDGIFETPGNRAIRSWPAAGTYIIWFKAVDDADPPGIGIDSTRVYITADSPMILPIPDQVIFEGSQFEPLDLDLFVTHPFLDPEDMVWTVSDTVELSASITDRRLTVLVPHENWFGEETLTLTVRDVAGFTDVGHVLYRVINVNDPPVWIQKVPDIVFDEDQTFVLSYTSLRPLVDDIDNLPSDFTFWIEGNDTIRVVVDSVAGRITFSAPQDWNGHEDVLIFVSDGAGGTAVDSTRIVVWPVPDPPDPFMVIEPRYMRFEAWPDTIDFSWHRPTDPDGEIINTFLWRLEPIEVSVHLPAIEHLVDDTVFQFYPDPDELGDGVWRWTVTAIDQDGLTRTCEIPGHLRKDPMTGVAAVPLPTTLSLYQNYPNPFNPETVIRYDLPKDERIELAVFNALGQKIAVLEDGTKHAGIHTVRWSAGDDAGNPVPSGIYICRLRTDSRVLYRKMMLVQ